MARILHYLDTDTFAGTEQHVLTLLSALSALGETCAILCRADTEFASRAANLVDVTVFPFPLRPLASVSLLRNCVRKWQPDIVHAHNGRTLLQTAWVCRSGGRRPVGIATQHFVEPAHTKYTGIKRLLANNLHHWANEHIRRTIAVSESVRQSAIAREHIPPERIVTIYNGIFPPKAESQNGRAALKQIGISGGPLVVTVARLAEEKGHRCLLAAVPEIKLAFPDVQFLWLGTGPLERKLRAEIQAAGLTDTVYLAGHRADVADFVALADLMALPSLCEPFGLALVEAMMLATPVVATACGGPMEIIAPAYSPLSSHEAAGWLVPPADSSALAQAICMALANKEQSARIGQRGQKRACTLFTPQTMALHTQSVYREALASTTG